MIGSLVQRDVLRSLAVLAGLLLAAGHVAAQTAVQASGQPMSNVSNTFSVPGLRIDVDSPWPDNRGYRPFRITVSPTKAVTADRRLTVVVRVAGRRWRPESPNSVAQDVLVPAGAQPGERIEATIAVPIMADTPEFAVEVFEDGAVITPTPARWTPLCFQTSQTRNIENSPRILFVGPSEPDTSALAQSFHMNEVEGVFRRQTAWPGVRDDGPPPGMTLQTVRAVSPADLPQRWIDYSCLDVVCLSVDQLQQLAKDRPEAFNAILAWTASGGNLWVRGVKGSDGPWTRLDELTKLLGFPPGDLEKGPTDGWTAPNEDLFHSPEDVGSLTNALRRSVGMESQANVGPAPAFTEPRSISSPPKPKRKPKKRSSSSSKLQFVFREHGLGMIVAMASPDPFAAGPSGKNGESWDRDDWKWLLLTAGPERILWARRHGLATTTEENLDYWQFLIPGVGLAPVTEFGVLITLFVFFIGPVNYYLLRRRKRLHLMVLTVPLGAAVVLFFVFAYALLADGLGIRVRARSLTCLDQRRGEAATWTRLSYYAGLAPSDGLRFSDRVAVYPIQPAAASRREARRGGRTGRRDVDWGEDQHLTRGWLDSRTPTQYLTVRSAPTKRRLVIGPSPGLTDELEVVNELDMPIDRLAIRSKKGKYYWVANVGVGQTVRATSTDLTQLGAWLGDRAVANRPALPDGMIVPNYYRGYGFNDEPPGEASQSLVERRFGELESLGSPGSFWLAPGSYVALTPGSPEVELGTPQAREEAGFHVIVGKW